MLGTKVSRAVLVNFLENLQLVAAEADDFDVEIIVDEFELFAQRDEGFVLAQKAAENVRKLEDHAAGHVRIEADERRDGIQRIEKKMRIDLAGERVHARFEQELLICSRFISMRVLFQILMAMATHITEESTTSSS